MKNAAQIRDEFLKTLGHIEFVAQKISAATVPQGKVFTFPDQNMLGEGLFLSAWTHWEQFVRELLVSDLASLADGAVRREVHKFPTAAASSRLARLVLNHPDERRWVGHAFRIRGLPWR
jgi:hypothetical protein